MKSIIFLNLLILCSLQWSEGLQCFTHELCSANCPELADTIKTCSKEENACFKSAVPGGVTRGCGTDRCDVQVNANSMLANVCCENDLCNSASRWSQTWSSFLTISIGWILAWK